MSKAENIDITIRFGRISYEFDAGGLETLGY